MLVCLRISYINDIIQKELRQFNIFSEDKVGGFYSDTVKIPDDESSLNNYVDQILDAIPNCKELFEKLNTTGGRIELYISYMLIHPNGSIHFPNNLIKKLASCYINLGVD